MGRLVVTPRFVVGAALFASIVVFAVLGPVLAADQHPLAVVGGPYDPPSGQHPLGTDNFGRSVLVQLMHGTRTSLTIGLIAGVAAITIGLVIGTLAGFRGGVLDELLMGATNVIITIPAIVVLLLLSLSLQSRSIEVMGLIIGVVGWPWTARAVRAQVSSLRTREHVDVGRLSGMGTTRLIAGEILPYMLSYVVMAFVIQLYGAVLAEAALSLLGLGPTGTVSLGIMLFWAIAWESVRSGFWWAFLPPTAFITLITFSLLLMQASLDAVFNPRLRRG